MCNLSAPQCIMRVFSEIYWPYLLHNPNICNPTQGSRVSTLEQFLLGTHTDLLFDGDVTTCASFWPDGDNTYVIKLSLDEPRRTVNVLIKIRGPNCTPGTLKTVMPPTIREPDKPVRFCNSYESTYSPENLWYCRSICHCPGVCDVVFVYVFDPNAEVCEIVSI